MPDTHTELAHRLMSWHLGFMAGSLLLFIAVTWVRWRNWDALPGVGTRFLMWLATAGFIVGAAFGGYIVYHGGAGIEEKLLKSGLHEEHHRGYGEERPEERMGHSGHESSPEHH